MAGMTMLAFGVVFVLLLGEIDLSIAYVSAIAGVDRSAAPAGGRSSTCHGIWPIVVAADRGRALIGAFQGSFVAIIGVPSFVVTLAGLLVWQGYVQLAARGRRPDHHPEQVDQLHGAVLLLEERGVVDRGDDQCAVRRRDVRPASAQQRRHGVAIRNPIGARAAG